MSPSALSSVDAQDLEVTGFLSAVLTLYKGSISEVKKLEVELFTDLLPLMSRDAALEEEIFALAALNGPAGVRAAALSYAIQRPETESARAFIAWETHDPEDYLAFRAIRACGELRLTSALRDLFTIIGPLSERLQVGAGKPVGVGHAVVMEAIQRIIDTSDLDEIRSVEQRYFEAAGPEDPGSGQVDGLRRQSSRRDSAVRVESFQTSIGLAPDQRPWGWFDYLGTPEPSSIAVDSLAVDRAPVSCAEYDEFASTEEAFAHTFCHPDEPEEKDHRRNTLMDQRFQPDAPAAGIDWFDAVAFASWAGGRLPSADEWEALARGPESPIFPWGRQFDGGRCQWLGRALGRSIESLGEWRALLCTVTESVPTAPVVSLGELDQCNWAGLTDLVGNVWEWTSSAFPTREPLRPATKGKSFLELAEDSASLAIIKGGAWSSCADLLVPAYCGKDLILDRHNEIGLRCVYDM